VRCRGRASVQEGSTDRSCVIPAAAASACRAQRPIVLDTLRYDQTVSLIYTTAPLEILADVTSILRIKNWRWRWRRWESGRSGRI